jgi:regulator of RNase E activity RraA
LNAVFFSGLTAATCKANMHTASPSPVDLEQLVSALGDAIVIADASGAVFIAAADIERVLKAAEMIVGREAAMAQALRAGQPVSQVMGADYEHMLK